MAEKHYPTDPRGQTDAGMARETRWPKPCSKRIDHTNMIGTAPNAITWCTQPEGHKGQCSGSIPRSIPPSPYAALRLRGLKQDEFADRIAALFGLGTPKENE